MAFFVDAEVTSMRAVDIDGTKILLIWRVEQCQILIQNICIFLLKNISVFGVDFVAIFVVFTILSNFINKEQRQSLNALRIQLLFLFKVRANGFTNLYTAKICFRNITDDFSSMDDFSVGKSNSATNRINLADAIATILLHVFGEGEQVIIYTENSCLTVNGFIVTNLEFNTSHRRLLWVYDDVFQKEVAVSTTQILDIKALYFNLLYQLFIVCIQGIQHIDQVVVLLVGGRVVQAE